VYLLGGASGTENLVAARGLEQPRAGKGVVRPGVEILSLWNRHFSDHQIVDFRRLGKPFS
jgi:hypothetical protein